MKRHFVARALSIGGVAGPIPGISPVAIGVGVPGIAGGMNGITGPRPAPRPNIIVIMAGGMGYSDIGRYGG